MRNKIPPGFISRVRGKFVSFSVTPTSTEKDEEDCP
jgi:hypothetical protein